MIPELRKFFEFDSGWDNPDTREVVDAMIECVDKANAFVVSNDSAKYLQMKDALANLRAKLEAGK